MTQKCDGVKILDLEGKNSFTGAEYAVIAEKDANYKIPLEQIGDVIINSSKFKAKVDRAYTASVPTASVALEDNEFTFTFGIPAGSKGDPGYSGKDGKNGKDGRDGIDGVPGIDGDTIRNVIAYKSTSTTARPDTPVGGSWDAVNNIVIYPADWVEQMLILTVMYGCLLQPFQVMGLKYRLGLLRLDLLEKMVRMVRMVLV